MKPLESGSGNRNEAIASDLPVTPGQDERCSYLIDMPGGKRRSRCCERILFLPVFTERLPEERLKRISYGVVVFGMSVHL